MQQYNYQSLAYKISHLSLALLLLLFISFLLPVCPDKTQALEENTTAEVTEETSTTDDSIVTHTDNISSVAISTQNVSNIYIKPTINGKFNSNTSDITIIANNYY